MFKQMNYKHILELEMLALHCTEVKFNVTAVEFEKSVLLCNWASAIFYVLAVVRTALAKKQYWLLK